MPTKLKVLILEDSASDAELALHELSRAGYEPEWKRVETEEEFLSQIGQAWEIILADYSLPGFSGLRALELLRKRDPDLPFIVVSGTIGEDNAFAAMKAGANDYIIKDRLSRLGSAVERELRDAGERRKRKQAEEALSESEEKYRSLFENSLMGISRTLPDGRLIFVNNAYARIYGYENEEELMAEVSNVGRLYANPEDQKEVSRILSEKGVMAPREFDVVRRDGTRLSVLCGAREIRDSKGNLQNYQAEQIDVTERRKSDAKLQETLTGLRNALGGIIQVLSAISEKRDPYTAGHQRRVADLAQAIARELGLPPDRVEGIRVAGVIHDIGKFSIPAELLSKPGSLSKIEHALIQYHAQVGHDILSDVKLAWPIAFIILQHHERMDGSGYPQHLKGGDIFLESRILAVSDVIEAMASHRPYRASLGIEAALKEIEDNKGVLYDPAVVAACLRLFREKGYKLKD